MRKEHRNDLILIFSIVAALLCSLLVIFLTKKKVNLIAKIYVKSELVETIDLNQSKDYEFEIEGAKGTLKISIKDHAIAVIDSNCPHKDCINMGYICETNRPIICAYNQVYIIIEGSSNYDVRI